MGRFINEDLRMYILQVESLRIGKNVFVFFGSDKRDVKRYILHYIIINHPATDITVISGPGYSIPVSVEVIIEQVDGFYRFPLQVFCA